MQQMMQLAAAARPGGRSQISILDRNVASKQRTEVNLHAFSLLFSSFRDYLARRSPEPAMIERRCVEISILSAVMPFSVRLDECGYSVGFRVLELIGFRERCNRQLKIQSMLSFISTTVWKTLFGKAAVIVRFPNGNCLLFLQFVRAQLPAYPKRWAP